MERTIGDALGSVLHSALIQASGFRQALIDARAAFDAGDDAHGKLLVNNAAVGVGQYDDPLGTLDSLTYAIRSAGDFPTGEGGQQG